jgi:hypothetical protein
MASDSQTENESDTICYMCVKPITAKNAAVISCYACSNQCHAGCFINKHGGSKAAHQWLADFIREENLFYLCKSCTDRGLRHLVSSSPSNAPMDLKTSRCSRA